MKLFSASWGVLKEDKGLAIFPVISTVATLVIIASFVVPVWFLGVTSTSGYDYYTQSTTSSVHVNPIGWLLIALGYFVLTYVTIFCNAALIYAANERLTGRGRATVATGFSGAAAKAGAIVPWALMSATISLALRMLEERLGLIGRIVVGIIGIAWALVTYLVVPVLILEGVSTTEAIRRSSQMFKDTWGENVIGNVGFGLFSFVAILAAMAIVAVGAISASPVILGASIVLAVLLLVGSLTAISAMSGVYRVALYRYASDGVPPSAFSGFDFNGAFRQKKSGMFGMSRSKGSGTPFAPTGQPHYGSSRPGAWTPPPVEPVGGSFGISIPGSDAQGSNAAQPGSVQPGPAPAAPQSPIDPGSGSPWGQPGQPPSPRGY